MARYSVVHNNHYSFREKVHHCRLEARLQPLDSVHQKVEFSQFVVRPLAGRQRSETDAFGNRVNCFEIGRELQSFSLSAVHTVTTLPGLPVDLTASQPWEQAVDNGAQDSGQTWRFLHPRECSPYTGFNHAMLAYARCSFLPGRPVLDAAFQLMQRVLQLKNLLGS